MNEGGKTSDDKPTAIPKTGGDITKDVPGHQERPLSEQEEVDVALDETFPASDPPATTRIEGPTGRSGRS